jgi:hypothetical protein
MVGLVPIPLPNVTAVREAAKKKAGLTAGVRYVP